MEIKTKLFADIVLLDSWEEHCVGYKLNLWICLKEELQQIPRQDRRKNIIRWLIFYYCTFLGHEGVPWREVPLYNMTSLDISFFSFVSITIDKTLLIVTSSPMTPFSNSRGFSIHSLKASSPWWPQPLIYSALQTIYLLYILNHFGHRVRESWLSWFYDYETNQLRHCL